MRGCGSSLFFHGQKKKEKREREREFIRGQSKMQLLCWRAPRPLRLGPGRWEGQEAAVARRGCPVFRSAPADRTCPTSVFNLPSSDSEFLIFVKD